MKTEAKSFRSDIRRELGRVLQRHAAAVAPDALRIDLHCHDRNSDATEETIGRLLNLPESWLPTDALLRTLRANGADALTITNHNNARSCWDALEKGEDVLPGAEFSCTLPGFDVGVHVLTYGFTPGQEATLNRLRKNLYRFLDFANAADLPTVLAHPLHFYSPGGLPPLEILDRFALLFERFEGLNGQRDAWQNLLTLTWIDGLDEEELEAAGRRAGLRPGDFRRRPCAKRAVGGSDCHMGVFAGTAGTLLHAPGWRASSERRADIALRALRHSPTAPYGVPCEEEKLAAAFLDYFCQVAGNMRDTGLARILAGRGSPREKIFAAGIAKAVFALRGHKRAARLLEMFHASLQGQRPGPLTRLLTPKAFRPIVKEMDSVAAARKDSAAKQGEALKKAMPALFRAFTNLCADQVTRKLRRSSKPSGAPFSIPDLLAQMDVSLDFPEESLASGVAFPLMGAALMAGGTFAATKVLHEKRPFLDGMAERLGILNHPKRVLWLTDTLEDRNGVSRALQSMLAEVRARDLPIDFLTCGEGSGGEHLLTLPPVTEFKLPSYGDQAIRLPDCLSLHGLFREGGYDRIICSTEAPMGLLALYLKHAFSVPAFFYVHSDWIGFAQRALRIDAGGLDRLRRLLSLFYRQFDGLFLLNREQRETFVSSAMGIPGEKIFLTAHWADPRFQPRPRASARESCFPGADENDPVFLYAGRISEEKGVLELPEIFRAIKARVPNAHMAFAGTGPCLERLRAELPEAHFLGWLEPEKLAEAYTAASLLLLPSWFDTFSCSLLEALRCGLPAIAYRSKGPLDILDGGCGGLLVEGAAEMAAQAIALVEDPIRLRTLKTKAKIRAEDFRPEAILGGMLDAVGLADDGAPSGDDFPTSADGRHAQAKQTSR